MEFEFRIDNDNLMIGERRNAFTGNVNTYICRFDIKCEIPDLLWFCVFKQGEEMYKCVIEDSCCFIPQEVLIRKEPVYVGCYGTTTDTKVKRISTKFVCLEIEEGAYSDATAPDEPTPEVWETLLAKNLP